MKRCMWFVGIVLLGMAAQAGADMNISTLPFGDAIISFGEPFTATFGQTITAPAVDNVLNSFSFWLADGVNPDFVDFAGYVMAWDGAKATGPILWSSAALSTTNNGGLDGYEEFTFNTGGLSLTSGAEYVMFLSASNHFDGLVGTAIMGGGATPYSGGKFVYMSNGEDFSKLTADSWGYFPWDVDAAFEAQFSIVPLPGAVLLGILGLSAAGLRLGRRTR